MKRRTKEQIARDIAMSWHGGQWSPLYAFGSSGTIVPGIVEEINNCMKLGENYPTKKEIIQLLKLRDYVKEAIERQEIADHWNNYSRGGITMQPEGYINTGPIDYDFYRMMPIYVDSYHYRWGDAKGWWFTTDVMAGLWNESIDIHINY